MGVILLGTGCLAATWVLWGGRPGAGWFRGPAERGRELYTRHCAACHGSEGQGRVRGNATGLNNPDFLAAASDAFLETTIARGRRGTEMPAWATESGGPLTRRDVQAVVAFIRRWQGDAPRRSVPKVVRGDPARGRELYAGACANCHGWTGQGELGMGPAVMNADLLAAADDGFLWATIAYGRRDTPMFPSLRGLDGVRQLSEQEISDVVAYLRRGRRE